MVATCSGSDSMPLYELDGVGPDLAGKLTSNMRCWVAPCATVVGHVRLEENASVWFGAVLRGDNEAIVIGKGSNVQDLAVMHTDPGFPLAVGENCTIGHRAIIHGCTIGDNTLIGMGATIMVASEKNAYTLTDRATYLALKENASVVPRVEGDPPSRHARREPGPGNRFRAEWTIRFGDAHSDEEPGAHDPQRSGVDHDQRHRRGLG